MPTSNRAARRRALDAKAVFLFFLELSSLRSSPAHAFEAPPATISDDAGVWRPLLPYSGFSTLAYDPAADRAVGWNTNGIWTRDLADPSSPWTLSSSSNVPVARQSAATAYDPVHNRLLMFGGYQGTTPIRDTWMLSLSGTPTWTPITPAGPLPDLPTDGQSLPTALYDSARDRLVVFWDNTGGPPGHRALWTLALSGTPAWSPLTPSGTGPSSIEFPVAIYDPLRDRMVMVAIDPLYRWNDRTWAVSFTGSPAWVSLNTPDAPDFPNLARPLGLYDAPRDRMILVGGRPPSSSSCVNRTWALPLVAADTWTALHVDTPLPPGECLATMAYDSARDRLLFPFGPITWALTLLGNGSWSQLDDPYPGTTEFRTLYDPVRDGMITHGAATYEMSFATRQWTQISATTPSDGPIVYDPEADRLIVYKMGNPSTVWVLPLSGSHTWSQLATAGSPPFGNRALWSAMYDPLRRRVLYFGGLAGTTALNELWQLTLDGTPTWGQYFQSGSYPVPRTGHTAVYDATNDRMVVFGGISGSTRFNDAWAFSCATSTWSRFVPVTQDFPPARSYHAAVIDPVRARLLIFGGEASVPVPPDAWELSLTGPPAWSAPARQGVPPIANAAISGIHDPLRDRMVLWRYSGSDVTALEWRDNPASTPTVPVAATALGLGPIAPNPARGPTRIGFDLPRSGHARLSVLDVQGRVVAVIADETLGPGRHQAAWNAGGAARAGIYFVRLEFERDTRTRRVAVVD